MIIDILTLFPDMFAGPFDTSMIKKAKDMDAVKINLHNIRDWTTDKHHKVDSRPFGGGPGMVLKVEPLYLAINELKTKKSKVILFTPQGETFTQKKAVNLTKEEHIILIAGHYEGFDQRVRDNLVDEEISIGNYVLTGGEIPAMAVTDAIVRLLPGVLEEEARESESFMDGNNLDYPQYTRPAEFNGWKVPEILLSGNHAEVEAWRKQSSKKKDID